MIKWCFIALLLALTSCRKTNQITVINQGVGGNKASDVVIRIDTALKSNPDLAIVMIGTNDVSRQVAYKTFTDNLSIIINRIKKSGAKVLLMSPPPRGTEVIGLPDSFKNGRTDTIASIIDSLGKKLNCYYLNINQAFKDAGTPSADKSSMLYNSANNPGKPDGIHLTVDGRQFIAAKVNRFIQDNLPKGSYSVVVCIGDSLTAGGSASYPAYLRILLNAQ